MSGQTRPLLIVDGDSFAHRYYHALPKSIRRADGGGGNLLDGVGGLLIRLWEEESPRAVLVAWDTLTVPTYRHTALPAYQSGRQFDRELLDQLDLMPTLVEAMGFAAAKVDGYVVCPCSMATLGTLASGAMDNLIHRAASVAIKEGRRLVLMPRETPLSTIHLDGMLRLRQAGAVILFLAVLGVVHGGATLAAPRRVQSGYQATLAGTGVAE